MHASTGPEDGDFLMGAPRAVRPVEVSMLVTAHSTVRAEVKA